MKNILHQICEFCEFNSNPKVSEYQVSFGASRELPFYRNKTLRKILSQKYIFMITVVVFQEIAVFAKLAKS